MKLKKPSELPEGKSYLNGENGYIDFDNGKLEFATNNITRVALSEKETKAMFVSMLMHYMANSDTDLFEMEG